MAKITFTSDLPVEAIEVSASDEDVIRAARVSTGLDQDDLTEERQAGLINYLVKKRHGSPFEHTRFTFRIEAPIFVFREFMRHRIASYNETSARYREMEPKFYIYPRRRPMVQEGSGAHPKLVPGTKEQTDLVNEAVKISSRTAWEAYQTQIAAGAALEVARAVLPVGTYSSMYVTMNARALMNFLSLRVDDADATFQTKPQWEIEQIARTMELTFQKEMPLTHAAFVKNGRVAP